MDELASRAARRNAGEDGSPSDPYIPESNSCQRRTGVPTDGEAGSQGTEAGERQCVTLIQMYQLLMDIAKHRGKILLIEGLVLRTVPRIV